MWSSIVGLPACSALQHASVLRQISLEQDEAVAREPARPDGASGRLARGEAGESVVFAVEVPGDWVEAARKLALITAWIEEPQLKRLSELA